MGTILNILGSVVSTVVLAPGVIAANPIQSAVVAAVTVIVGGVAKKTDNDTIEKWIQAVVGMPCYALGVTITVGLSKWKWTAGWWNKYIEAYFIDLLQHIANIPIVAIDNIIRGVRSDNNLKRSI